MTRATAQALMLVVALATSKSGRAQAPDTLPAKVEGRRVHMISLGTGSPTVILEAGYGSTTRTWTALQRELGKSHRVIAYDRAGLGRSEPSPRLRTARTIAEELRVALRSVDIEPPYLLVAHSAGGLHARVFAGMYPDEVRGLVLVDPTPEDFYARAQRELPRVFAYFDSVDMAGSADASSGERAEDAGWDAALSEARESDGRYHAPVIVLSSPRPDLRELGALWTDEHRRWVESGRRREYVRLDGVGHNIHRERPDAVLEAVRRVQRMP